MKTKTSKNILGIFAILIMMHHLGQKVSASWVPDAFRQKGLGVFVPIGYLLVSFFFFCSGYGLLKSAKTKEDYFKGFLLKKFNNTLLVFIVVDIIYFCVRIFRDAVAFPLNPYSWFVATIVILYVGFFLIYKKEGKSSFLLMSLWVVAYTLISYLTIKGNWWMNATPAFLVGIHVASKEEIILQKIRNKKALPIVISALLAAVAFFISENSNAIYSFLKMSNYEIINIFKIVVQMVASSAFSLFVYFIATLFNEREKSSLIGKVLSFYGSLTLEFYLIHGLYVQIFGHHFLDNSLPPVYHIKNLFLYILVVFALSTLSAFLLKKFKELVFLLYEKSAFFEKLCNEQKKLAFIVCGLFVIVTVIASITSHNKSKENEALVNQYRDEFIDFVDVYGSNVATYADGEGEYTLVFLSSYSDPGSTVYLRLFTEKLKKQYRVLIIDYPGKGFSEDREGDKNLDYFADTIYEVLEKTEEENIILLPQDISALYAYRFIEKYPDRAVGLIGLNAAVPEIGSHLFDANSSFPDEYKWNIKRNVEYQGAVQKLMVNTGYVRISKPPYELIFGSEHNIKKWYPVMDEMFISNYLNPANKNEVEKIYDNCEDIKNFTFPEDYNAWFLLDKDYDTKKYYGLNWSEEYQKMIADEENQKVVHMSPGTGLFSYKVQIDGFVSSLKEKGIY